jgi:photosystem II stability/assembly factor-like uncharacterized protein
MRTSSLGALVFLLFAAAVPTKSLYGQWATDYLFFGSDSHSGLFAQGDTLLFASSRSTDGGISWHQPLSSGPYYIFDLVHSGAGNIFAPGVRVNIYHDSKGRRLGHSFTGEIYHSKDFGANWKRLELDTNFINDQPNQMHFWDELNGYTLQSAPLLEGPGTSYRTDGLGSYLVTSDGGATWSGRAITTPSQGYAYYTGAMYDADFGIYNGRITRDGGATWSIAEGLARGINARYTDLIFAEGKQGNLLHSADRGSSWDSTELYIIGEVFMLNSTTGYVLAKLQDIQEEPYRRFRTTDGGRSWSLMQGELDDLIASKPFIRFDRLDDSMRFGVAHDGWKARDSLFRFRRSASTVSSSRLPASFTVEHNEIRFQQPVSGQRYAIVDVIGRVIEEGNVVDQVVPLRRLSAGHFFVMLNGALLTYIIKQD